MPATPPQTWTTRSLLAWMIDAFEKKEIDSPRLCAELLMSHVIGCDRLRLYMEADRPAAALERETLRGLVGRALKHEPVQYLVGEGWFYGLPFKVDSRVLVPRPSSETIVETVLHDCRADPALGGKSGTGTVIADVCTGSGCLAIALLSQLPGARVLATDISSDALEVAGENASKHGVSDRMDLLEGDLLGALSGQPGARDLHFLVSNPPYIPDHEWADVEPNVKDHEPTIALRGGVDGLDFVRPLIAGAPDHLRPGGHLLIEVAGSCSEAALELARQQPGLADERVATDLEGHPRVVIARREG